MNLEKLVRKVGMAIILTIIGLVVLFQIEGFVEKSYSSLNRDAALATVNGGECEFLAQQAIFSGQNLIHIMFVFADCMIVLVSVSYIYKNIKKFRKEESGSNTQVVNNE